MARFSVYLVEEWQRRIDVEADSDVEAAETVLSRAGSTQSGEVWCEFVQAGQVRTEDWSDEQHGTWGGE